jgi:hypothetical protein
VSPDADGPSDARHDVAAERTPASGARVSVLTWIALGVGGLVLGSLGALVQADRRVSGDRTVPWGLVLVVVVVAVCIRAASYLVGNRRGGAVVAAGWLVPTLVLSGQGPGGDVILPSTARSTWYLGATAVIALVALLWPLPRGADALAAERRGATRHRHHDDGRAPEPAKPDVPGPGLEP